MTEGGILIFTGFVCILFMAVGILGIYRKNQFAKRMQNMYKLNGVLVDSNVSQIRDEDNFERDVYFPIYEYEWGGEKKRLESTTSGKIKIGKKVHILVDSQTEKAICLEDEKSSNAVLLLFGVIGAVVFILVLAIGITRSA